jgi:Thioredoxin
MTLLDWFKKGMTFDEYVEKMEVNKEELLQLYNKAMLTEEEKAFFQGLANKPTKVIVLAADWCGDALLCVPVMKHITETLNIDMHLLIRDDNLELMDQYLTNGTARAIPIFIFIDDEGTEKAVWGPRSPYVQDTVVALRSGLPPKEAPDFEEKVKEVHHTMKEKFLHDKTMAESVIKSVQEKLNN